MKKIGLFGGTFNPIHIGHLAIAEAATEILKLDKIIFIPSYIPPHKGSRNVISEKYRFEMVKLATKNNVLFETSDFEIKKPGRSYSFDTIKHFKKAYSPKAKFYFLIGADMLKSLHLWKRINEIKKMVTFVAINRLGYNDTRSKIKVRSIKTLDLGISSTYIRQRVKAGKTVRYLIPGKVLDYIKQHKLYTR